MQLNLMYHISRTAFEITVRLLMRIKNFGTENFPKPPFIIASNHASLMDPPIVGACYRFPPINFMAKRELFEVPIIGKWTGMVRCIRMNRGDNSTGGLKEALRRIKRGEVVGIFPEGTRTRSGELLEAKTGTGFLIAKAQVPVVPVYVYGSGEGFPVGKGLRLGTRVGAFIGKPIQQSEFPASITGKRNYEEISNIVMNHINALKKDADEYLGQFGGKDDKIPNPNTTNTTKI